MARRERRVVARAARCQDKRTARWSHAASRAESCGGAPSISARNWPRVGAKLGSRVTDVSVAAQCALCWLSISTPERETRTALTGTGTTHRGSSRNPMDRGAHRRHRSCGFDAIERDLASRTTSQHSCRATGGQPSIWPTARLRGARPWMAGTFRHSHHSGIPGSSQCAPTPTTVRATASP